MLSIFCLFINPRLSTIKGLGILNEELEKKAQVMKVPGVKPKHLLIPETHMVQEQN